MSNLLFKWGNHASLPSSISANDVGTLFFTKDEGGLYVGTESGKAPRRIQGVVQYYANLDQFKSNVLPPYSEDVIYYIASENALVKWNGSKVSGDKNDGAFIVLNVTASEFNTLAGNVNTLSDLIGVTSRPSGNTNSVWEELNAINTLIDVASRPSGNTNSVWDELVALAESIDSISGGEGTSLKVLNERLEAIENLEIDKNYVSVSNFNTFKESNTTAIGLKADKSYVDTELGKKADTTYVDTELGKKADTSYVNTELGKKANADEVYSKDTADIQFVAQSDFNTFKQSNTSAINAKADKSYVDTELDKKANASLFDMPASGDATGDYSKWVQGQINTKLQAAEAMVYMGGVESSSNLPNTAQAGHTYVLTAVDTATSGRPGDLFVANVDNPTSLAGWTHVKTGYDPTIEQTLSADANGINLTSINGKVDTVKVSSVSDNITVSIANNEISIGLQWAEF